MKTLLRIATRSALNRRGTLALVMLSIALATALLLGLERLRGDIRSSFTSAVSGTDLVVGPRTGPVQLMLYAVFHIGSAANTVSMDSVRALAAHRAVDWVVPIALGEGPGAAARASMAKVIVGGQALSLLLSLLVTPVAYSLFDDMALWWRRKTVGREAPVVDAVAAHA